MRKPKTEVEFVLMHAQTAYARKAITQALCDVVTARNGYKINLRRAEALGRAVVTLRRANSMDATLRRAYGFMKHVDRGALTAPEHTEFLRLARAFRALGYEDREQQQHHTDGIPPYEVGEVCE